MVHAGFGAYNEVMPVTSVPVTSIYCMSVSKQTNRALTIRRSRLDDCDWKIVDPSSSTPVIGQKYLAARSLKG